MTRLTFIILCIEGALLSFNVAATAALIPTLASTFGVSPFIAGNVVWLYMLPYGLAALVYGPLVRIIDAKRLELFCFFLFSCANILAGMAASMKIFCAARVCMGLFGASVIPLVIILLSQSVIDGRRGKMVGIFFSATFLASLAGLFMSGIIPWRLIYLVPGCAGLVLCVAMALWLPSFKQHATGITIHYLSALKNKNVLSLILYIFFVSLCYHGIQQWLSVYCSVHWSLSQFTVSMLITLTSLSGILGEVVGGFLSDIAGRLSIINAGIALMVISVFVLMLKLPIVAVAIIMFIWGVGWTFNHAGLSASLTDLPREYINEAASLNSSIRFLAGGIGVALGGVLMRINPQHNFLVFGYGLVILGLLGSRLLRTSAHPAFR